MSTRFNWNIFPSTRLEASHLVTPVGCLYKPFDEKNVPTVEENPTACTVCENYMNRYVKFDRVNNMWWCPFCENRSFLPDNFRIPPSNSASEHWPIQVQPQTETVDYVLPRDISSVELSTNVHFFVLDLYDHSDHSSKSSFRSLQKSIGEKIRGLPPNSLVGLVSFDETVRIHKPTQNDTIDFSLGDLFASDPENNQPAYSRAKLFDNEAIYKVLGKLGMKSFVLPTEFSTSPIKDLLVDPETAARYLEALRPKLTDSFKSPRATGLALFTVSVLLNKASYRGLNAKLSLYVSGPCTVAPGNIVDSDKMLRSHNDIVNFKSPHFLAASKFYQTIGLIASGLSFEVANSIVSSSGKKETDFSVSSLSPKWTIGIFTGSLDQVGVYEMKSMASYTMGGIHLYDSFDSPQFLNRPSQSPPQKIHNTLTVKTSSKLKVSRMISHGRSLPSSYQSEKHYDLHHEKISDHLSEFDCNIKKKNFTNQWGFNRLDEQDTLSIFFDYATVGSSSQLAANGVTDVYIQFSMKFWDDSNQRWILRVTTISKKTTLAFFAANPVKMSDGTTRIVNSKSKLIAENAIVDSFDQSTFIVLLARLLLDKIDSTLGFEKFDDIIRDVDSSVVKLMHNFKAIKPNSNYDAKSNPFNNVLSSVNDRFIVAAQFNEILSLAFNLRRNPQLIRIFNSSPDETAFYHHWFMRSDLETSRIIIQPNLYQLTGEVTKSITLDSQNVFDAPIESCIVMDGYFHVIVYSCQEARWKLHPSENSTLVYDRSEKLQNALSTIDQLQARRIQPKYVVTQKNHSQARFLLARLNPVETIEQKLEQVQIEEPSGFWGFLGFRTQSTPKSYNHLMTDDASLNQYYDGIIGLSYSK